MRSEFGVLLRFKLLAILRSIRRLPPAQKGIGVFFGLIVLAFMAGGFELAFRIFTYLKLQAVVGRPLAFHMLDLLLLTFFTLLVASSVVSAIPTLFTSREIPYLMGQPVRHRNVFLVKFVENFLYTSWATFVLATPVLLAFSVAFRIPWPETLVILLGLLPLVFLAVSVGTLLALLGAFALRKLSPRSMTLVILAVIALLAAFGLRAVFPSLAPLEQIESFTQFNRYLATLELTTPYAPSSWLVELVRAGLTRNLADLGFFSALLASSALAAFQLAYLLGRATYYRSWSRSLEAREARPSRTRRTSEAIRRLFPGVAGSLVLKDLRTFSRDAAELTQTLFLAVLLTVYLLIVSSLPKVQPTTSFWQTIIAYIHVGTLGYFLATFAMRFVFPAISLEGQASWMLWAAPFRQTRIFWTKLLTNVAFFLLVTEALTLVTSHILKLDPFVRNLSLLVVLLLDVSLVSLSLSMGAIFPNFREANPSRMSSSASGIVTILLSLGYVLAVVILLAPAISSHFGSQFQAVAFNPTTLLTAGIGILVASGLTTILPITFALRRLKRYDF